MKTKTLFYSAITSLVILLNSCDFDIQSLTEDRFDEHGYENDELEPESKGQVFLNKFHEEFMKLQGTRKGNQYLISLLDSATNLDSNLYSAHYNKHTLYPLIKDTTGAINNFSQLIRLAPRVPAWKAKKALLLEMINDSIDAKRLFEECIKQSEDSLKLYPNSSTKALWHLDFLVMANDTVEAKLKLMEF